MRTLLISKKDEWYEEGTIALLTGIDDELDPDVNIFMGVPNSNPACSSNYHFNKMTDEEGCSLDEFIKVEVSNELYKAIYKTFSTMVERHYKELTDNKNNL